MQVEREAARRRCGAGAFAAAVCRSRRRAARACAPRRRRSNDGPACAASPRPAASAGPALAGAAEAAPQLEEYLDEVNGFSCGASPHARAGTAAANDRAPRARARALDRRSIWAPRGHRRCAGRPAGWERTEKSGATVLWTDPQRKSSTLGVVVKRVQPARPPAPARTRGRGFDPVSLPTSLPRASPEGRCTGGGGGGAARPRSSRWSSSGRWRR